MNKLDPEIQTVVATLDSIESLEDNNLQALHEAIEQVYALPPHAEQVIEALLRVLERFPEEDSYGVFWGILHTLEKMPGRYESPLVQSIQRQPSEFSLNMLYRILKDGQTEAGGINLYNLLESVATDSRWSEDIRKDAQHSILALRDYGIGPTEGK